VKLKLVGIGEVLWDLFPGGRQLGGAPANFAYHAGALGAEAWVVSRVGRDEAGRDLLRRLEQLGVRTDGVEVDPLAPTGTVTVAVAADGQPRFTIHEDAAWDRLADGASARVVADADAVCFGTLAQRSNTTRQTIHALLRSVPPKCWRILDVNLRQHYYSRAVVEGSLALANVLKVNDTELLRLTELFGLPGDEREQLAELARRFQLRAVACTRGGHGSLVYWEGQWSEHPGIATQVVDTVGAGDAFTAALALGLLAGWSLADLHQRAGEVAAYVCSQPGATPELPQHLRAPFLAS
jgi:fructokinase